MPSRKKIHQMQSRSTCHHRIIIIITMNRIGLVKQSQHFLCPHVASSRPTHMAPGPDSSLPPGGDTERSGQSHKTITTYSIFDLSKEEAAVGWMCGSKHSERRKKRRSASLKIDRERSGCVTPNTPAIPEEERPHLSHTLVFFFSHSLPLRAKRRHCNTLKSRMKESSAAFNLK